MVVAENAEGLFGLGIKENCNPKDAETFQVEEYLLKQIERLFNQENDKDVVVASYLVDPEGKISHCLMGERIWVDNESVRVADYQWSSAAGMILFQLGEYFHDVVTDFARELNEHGWAKKEIIKRDDEGEIEMEVRSREKAYPVDPKKLRRKLSRLGIGESQYELVAVGKHTVPLGKEAEKTAKEEREWQILVRRKVDEVDAVAGEDQYFQG